MVRGIQWITVIQSLLDDLGPAAPRPANPRQHIALFNNDNLDAASRERFVGLADIRSSANLCGYNIDFQLFSRGLNFLALRPSFWVSHIVEQSNARRSGNKFACNQAALLANRPRRALSLLRFHRVAHSF